MGASEAKKKKKTITTHPFFEHIFQWSFEELDFLFTDEKSWLDDIRNVAIFKFAKLVCGWFELNKKRLNLMSTIVAPKAIERP